MRVGGGALNDEARVAAVGPDVRSLVVERTVDAAPMTAWSDWASSDGITSWWLVPRTRIELRVGGPFEILFSADAPEGTRGSEGCHYLAYVPGEMISFTWNAPPSLSLRESHTWVVITFTPDADGRTRVRLVHTGFLEGPDWDEYMAYFRDAWSYVLDLQAAHHR
jgi:uncharacterized protein YndB with AHSA1/START domain